MAPQATGSRSTRSGSSMRRQRRKDFLHKLSHDVARDFDAVIVEDINLQHMSQALNFGKSVYDNGYGMLREMLAYKLNDQG